MHEVQKSKLLRGLSYAFAAIWLAFGLPQWLRGASQVAATWQEPSLSSLAADMLARAGGLYMVQLGLAQLAVSIWATERMLRLFLWITAAQCGLALCHWGGWMLPNERIMAGFPAGAGLGLMLSWGVPAAIIVGALAVTKPAGRG